MLAVHVGEHLLVDGAVQHEGGRHVPVRRHHAIRRAGLAAIYREDLLGARRGELLAKPGARLPHEGLGGRGGPLVEIDEVGLDPTLGKETQRGAGVGALPDTEDLHVHTSCRSRTARRPARRAPAAWLRASPPGARLPRRAARGCASRPRAPPRLRCRRRSSPRPRARAASARPAAGSAARERAAPQSRARAAWAAPRGDRIAGPGVASLPRSLGARLSRCPFPLSRSLATRGGPLRPATSLLRTAADPRGTEWGRAPRRRVPRPAGRPPAPSPGCPAPRSAAAGRTQRL